MNRFVKIALLAALMLAVFCGAACADEYVKRTVENGVEPSGVTAKEIEKIFWEKTFEPLPIDDSFGAQPKEENHLPDNTGYRDESISVEIETIHAYDTTIMVAYIQIQHPSQLRTTMAARYGSTKVTYPKIMAERVNAVFAVNGDYFNYRKTGYLVRQGTLYRDRPDPQFDTLLIDAKGDFHIVQDPTEETMHAYVEGMQEPVINSFNFGPALVMDGEMVLPVKYFDAGTTRKTQRMAIAQMGELSYMCVATEGPENKGSLGLTMEELVHLMYDLGAKTAYNLDGGSSSTFVLKNKKINALSANKIRTICDIIYFATLAPQE